MNTAEMHLNCPVCGEEMEYGDCTFDWRQGILWLPTGMTRRKMKKITGAYFTKTLAVHSEKDTVRDNNGEWICEPELLMDAFPRIPCHLCRTCKKAIFHYGELGEFV